MKLPHFLTSKTSKEAALTIVLFIAAAALCALGLYEPYRFLVFVFPIPLYFLLRRLSVWSAACFGFSFGVYVSIPTYLWLTRFERFDPFVMAMVVYGLVFLVLFALTNWLINRYPQNLFIQIFACGWIFYLIEFILHWTFFVKAFVKISNAPTMYDWVYPYFGTGIVEGIILATGFFLAVGLSLYLTDQPLQKLKYFALFFLIVGVVIPLIKSSVVLNTKHPKVQIEAIQYNANFSWEERVARVDEIFQYYLNQTSDAAHRGIKIVVWPEYAVPIDIVNKNHKYVVALEESSKKLDVVIVLGSIQDSTAEESKNGAYIGYDLSLVVDPIKGLLEPYRAVHPYSSNILPGPKPMIFQTKYGNFPVLSCFEISNHKFVADYFARGVPIDFIIGIANNQVFDGTYGYTRLKNHARTIAAENNRYLLYVTNTGPTTIFNSSGEEVDRVPYSTQGIVSYNVEKNEDRSVYSIFQEWLPLLLTSGVFWYVLKIEKSKNSKKPFSRKKK